MIEIIVYQNENGREPFYDWLEALDNTLYTRINKRLNAITETSNFGDYKNLGDGICELRFDFGSGYGIYFAVLDHQTIALLLGGDKKTQTKDIKKPGNIGETIMNKKIKYRTFNQLTIEHFRKNPEFADEFLDFSLKEFKKDGDEKTLLLSLKQIAIAKGGFTNLANKTGLSRESLYKTLSATGNPKFSTLRIILESLGYGFVIKPLSRKSV